MLAELLLVLAGHPSTFFTSSPSNLTPTLNPSLIEYLHPGEIASLNTLGELAYQYRTTRDWARQIQQRGREAVRASSSKGKQKQVDQDVPDLYLATLAGGILDTLKGYEMMVVETEARILSFDPGLVQDQQGFVPLSSLIATFSKWQAPMSALANLTKVLSDTSKWTPGNLLQLLYDRSQTGNPHIQSIFTSLLRDLRHLFLTHLISFLLFGFAPTASTPTQPAIALDIGADPLSPQHRVYALNDGILPPNIRPGVRESILYVGRVAATLKREGRALPKEMVDGLRVQIMSVDEFEEEGGLDQGIRRARAEVGEWLWKNVLTGPQIVESLTAFGNYFLTRKSDYSDSLVREIIKLHQEKLLTSNPHSSASVIKDQDLNRALIRASLGTTAESDKAIDDLRLQLDNGPLRAIEPHQPNDPYVTNKTETHLSTNTHIGAKTESPIRHLFSSSLLGAPITLVTKISWPLDLFMTPPAISAYSDIHAYLTSIRHTQLRVLDSWTSLSGSRRHTRGMVESIQQKELIRSTWGLVRAMLFFLDQILSHFMVDIIDVQHRYLLNQLSGIDSDTATSSESGLGVGVGTSGSMRSLKASTIRSAPGQGAESISGSVRGKAPRKFLDFLTLRQMHARHLSFLHEGLLLSDRGLAVLMRDILDTCTGFSGLIERWGGDVLPPLSGTSDEQEDQVLERTRTIQDLSETLQEQLSDFFGALVESQNPTPANETFSNNTHTAGISFSKTARAAQMIHSSRAISRQTSFMGLDPKAQQPDRDRVERDKDKDERGFEAEILMGRHVEQLLLRLDFNGVLTAWRTGEEDRATSRNLLAEGGL